VLIVQRTTLEDSDPNTEYFTTGQLFGNLELFDKYFDSTVSDSPSGGVNAKANVISFAKISNCTILRLSHADLLNKIISVPNSSSKLGDASAEQAAAEEAARIAQMTDEERLVAHACDLARGCLSSHMFEFLQEQALLASAYICQGSMGRELVHSRAAAASVLLLLQGAVRAVVSKAGLRGSSVITCKSKRKGERPLQVKVS